MAKILGNNPLLAKPVEEEPVLTEEEVAAIRAAQSDVDDFTTMSFKIRKTYLKKLRDYAYTNRIEIKYALDEALGLLLDTLIHLKAESSNVNSRCFFHTITPGGA